MLNALTITNHLGESIRIEMRSPERSGFLIKNIDGLGPVKADIAMSDVTGMDGSIYNSSRATKRNIVLTLAFIGMPDIERTRQKSYKYFPLKKQITVKVEADHRVVMTRGYVESNEPNIFSQEEGCVISIVCPSSYLYDITPSITTFSSTTKLFTFPFSNESLVSPLIILGDLNLENTKSVYYEGEASVGIVIYIHAIGIATGVEIVHVRTLEKIVINDTLLIALTGSGIVEGDQIVISTVRGNKFAKLIRGGIETNILNVLGDNPVWFQLEMGDNLLAYTAVSGLANLEFRIENEIAYEGV